MEKEWIIQSNSRLNTEHTVRKINEEYYCTCEHEKFRKSDNPVRCNHIVRVMDEEKNPGLPFEQK